MVIAGATHAMPPQRTTIAAAGDPARQLTQVGTEDVTAAGKTFSCRIYVPTAPKPDSKLQVKVWWCKEVPGGVVKVEIDTSGKKIVQTLKRFEVK